MVKSVVNAVIYTIKTRHDEEGAKIDQRYKNINISKPYSQKAFCPVNNLLQLLKPYHRLQ